MKNQNKKLTLEALIAKKAEKEASRNPSEDMYFPSLDGEITLTVPNRSIIYKAFDMMGDTLESQIYANKFLIYNSVAIFRNKELLEAYEITDNVEIVDVLLTMAEINDAASKILTLGGIMKPDDAHNEVKN